MERYQPGGTVLPASTTLGHSRRSSSAEKTASMSAKCSGYARFERGLANGEQQACRVLRVQAPTKGQANHSQVSF